MKLIRADTSKSRSEEVRTRRTQTSQQRAARTARGVTLPANRSAQPPPVTVRSRSAAVPAAVARKSRPKPRRQFYYALGSTGAEVRLPAVPMLRPGWRLLSALLTLLLGAAIYFAYTDPMFQVQQVEITGLKRIKKAEVQKLIGLTGQPIVTFAPSETRALLEKTYPELAAISISISLPAQIAVDVTERQPILAWKKGEKTYWADKEGYLFSPRGEMSKLLIIESDEDPPIAVEDTPLPGEIPTTSADSADQAGDEEEPRLKGVLGKKIDPGLLAAASVLKKKIDTDSALLYSSTDGLGWNDAAGWRVYVGVDLDDIQLKLNVYAAVVERLNKDGIQPAMISVENVHAPFYRME